MKVMYVVEAYPRLSEIFIAREIYALEELGMDIDVLCLSKPPSSNVRHALVNKIAAKIVCLEHEQIGRLEKALGHVSLLAHRPAAYLHLAKNVHDLPLSSNSSYLFRQLPVLQRIFRESGAKRLHAHFGWTGLVAAWMMSGVLDVPYSVTLHGSDVLVSPYPSLDRLLRGADQVACVSEAIRKAVISMGVGRGKTQIIHCGVDTDEFRPPEPDRRPTRLRILTVARLHPVKGLKTLVEACALLDARGIDFLCSIVGDGQEREALEEQIRELNLKRRVHLLGNIPNEKLAPIYGSHSVFVLPSLSEGLSVVIMEAMASGLPIVATRVGGLPEIVQDGVNGRLVEPLRPDQLAESVIQLHRLSCGEQKVVAFRNRAKVIEEFDIRKEAERLFNVFHTECTLRPESESAREAAEGG